MKSLPKLNIAHLPTPVEPLPRLSKALAAPQIWVKRDDQTGLAFGGNKSRKLQYLVADALAQGARTLLTAGAIQSNHCRQTAAAARRAGLDCILVLVGDAPDDPDGNLYLDLLMGADLVWTTLEQRDEALQAAHARAQSEGRHPYLIPYGGSNAIGASAYAYAIQELMAQELSPDWIVFATSSGGTQAGMVVGSQLFDFQGQVLGISVDEPAELLQARVAELANQTAAHLDASGGFSPQDVRVNADYLGGGYAVLGAPEIEAIRLFARHEGLLLDPVYTGRAAAGMIDLVRQGFFKPDDRLLFWHTGGAPALFAEKYRGMLL